MFQLYLTRSSSFYILKPPRIIISVTARKLYPLEKYCRPSRLLRLCCAFLLLCITLQLSGCIFPYKELVDTQLARQVDTAESLAKTAAVTIQAQAKGEIETALATLQTKAASVVLTAIDQPVTTPKPSATLEPALPSPTGSSVLTPEPEEWSATIQGSFPECFVQYSNTETPEAGSLEIFNQGFSMAKGSCNAAEGSFVIQTLVFGGREGNMFTEADQTAEASGAMKYAFISPFQGDLRVDVTMVIRGDMGSAAGSATIAPDLEDVILLFIPVSELIKQFYDIGKGLFLGTFTGVTTDAILTVKLDDVEKTESARVKGMAASFPMPPWNQSASLDQKEIKLTMTIPVVEGQKVDISTGLKVFAKTHGWSTSYWNPSGKEHCNVTQITLTQVK